MMRTGWFLLLQRALLVLVHLTETQLSKIISISSASREMAVPGTLPQPARDSGILILIDQAML